MKRRAPSATSCLTFERAPAITSAFLVSQPLPNPLTACLFTQRLMRLGYRQSLFLAPPLEKSIKTLAIFLADHRDSVGGFNGIGVTARAHHTLGAHHICNFVGAPGFEQPARHLDAGGRAVARQAHVRKDDITV